MKQNFFQKTCPQYLKHSFCRRGITALEILITVSILTVLVLVVLPQFSKMRENQILKNTTEDIISSLHTAQSQSLASVDSSEYGVRFESSRIVIFKGKVFSDQDSNNKIINIISPANISDVFLNGTSSNVGDIYFERLSGMPSKSGNITVSGSSISKIITISNTGSISLN